MNIKIEVVKNGKFEMYIEMQYLYNRFIFRPFWMNNSLAELFVIELQVQQMHVLL